jgi:hypothetical protein
MLVAVLAVGNGKTSILSARLHQDGIFSTAT